jgi:hypothetical protein
MEFVAAEKYIKRKYRGWPAHAAAIFTASLSVGLDQLDIATAVTTHRGRSIPLQL